MSDRPLDGRNTPLTLYTDRLQLICLNRAQLQAYLEDPARLERELGFAVSRDIVTASLVRALNFKIEKMSIADESLHQWYTYWLLVVSDVPFGAGLVGFKGRPDEHGEVEIGYGIDPAYQRRGYMTEAVRALIAWAFRQAECRAVTAPNTLKTNPASNRVLAKVGMRVYIEGAHGLWWRIDRPKARPGPPPGTLYLIGGAARAGKTLLTHRLFRAHNIPYFCVDYIVSALDQGAPELGIDAESPNVIRAAKLWPRIVPMLRNIVEVEPAYTVEGDALLPRGVRSLMDPYPGQVRACFLGFANATPQQKLHDIRAHVGAVNDWIQDYDDDYILTLMAEMIDFSRYVREECQTWGLPYVDVSRDFAAGLERAYLILTAADKHPW